MEKPVNLRSMLAVAADVCNKIENEEDVNTSNQELRLKAISEMRAIIETGIKLTTTMISIEGFAEKWNQVNPQLKNYDALPE